MSKIDDAIGKQFGKLKLLRRSGPGMVECQCDCGNIKVIRYHSIDRKLRPIKSCGCLRDSINRGRVGDVLICNLCHKELPNEDFYLTSNKHTRSGICKICTKNRAAMHRLDNIDEHRNRTSANLKKWRFNIKTQVLCAYGGQQPCCACCGETRIQFLAIDHINGGGTKHRKSIGVSSGHKFYLWLRNNDYPPGFRVLCHNCNQAIGSYGVCPHSIEENNGSI